MLSNITCKIQFPSNDIYKWYDIIPFEILNTITLYLIRILHQSWNTEYFKDSNYLPRHLCQHIAHIDIFTATYITQYVYIVYSIHV